MALIKSHTLNSGFSGDYWKANGVYFTKAQAGTSLIVRMYLYQNEAKRISNLDHWGFYKDITIGDFDFDDESELTYFQQIYEAVLEDPFFSEATNTNDDY